MKTHFADDDTIKHISKLEQINKELVGALERNVRYLADLNGCKWIGGDDAGSVDMRQRAKGLQSLTFAALKKAKGQ